MTAGLEQGGKGARDYLLRHARDRKFEVNIGQPGQGGRLFYDDRMDMNFRMGRAALADIFAGIDANVDKPDAPAIYLSSLELKTISRDWTRPTGSTSAAGERATVSGSERARRLPLITTSRTISRFARWVGAGSRCFRPNALPIFTLVPWRTRRRGARSAWSISPLPTSTDIRGFESRWQRRRLLSWSLATRCSFRPCGTTTSRRSTLSMCW